MPLHPNPTQSVIATVSSAEITSAPAGPLTKFEYSISPRANVTEPGFEGSVHFSWEQFKKILCTDFQLDQAVHPLAKFQFSFADKKLAWFGINTQSQYQTVIIDPIQKNASDIEEARKKGRKEVKNKLPLVIRLVSLRRQIRST